MKYIDINTVINSYKGFQECMTNKSWGYLALLKGCKSSIQPSIPYEVNMDIVSNFLETIFNLSSIKRTYNGGRSLYVFFSNKWETFFNDQGRFSPNIYDIAIWSYRRKAFPDNTTEKDIINIFSKEFNIPYDIIANSFNTEKKAIIFTDSLYKEENLKSGLKQIGVDVSKDNIDAKKGGVVAAPGEISRGPFIQPLYAGLDVTDYVLILQSNYNSLYIENTSKNKTEINNYTKLLPLQQIYFGAPGTGKSHEIKDQIKKHKSFRITFHPDTDYSSFVGAYKPTSVEVPMLTTLGEKAIPVKDMEGNPLTENKIIYTYVKQAFLNAYIEAWKERENENPQPVFLVIEEINRGNCAQIFGDIFQLLDRNDAGFSDYAVVPDTDLSRHVRKDLENLVIADKEEINALYEECEADIVDKVLKGDVLLLPNNLYIWATMNTSDQSLFPIDSAFKRRWDWKYIKIADAHKNWQIKIGTKTYDWWQFVQAINYFVFDATQSEDKNLGYFFAKAKDSIINAETFVSKVTFYLYTDVFKDYGFSGDIFRGANGEEMTFQSFYNADGSPCEAQIACFIENVIYSDALPVHLKVTETANDEDMNVYDEDEAVGNRVTSNRDKYAVNGAGSYGKCRAPFEAVKTYASINTQMNAAEIVQVWSNLNVNHIPHLVETEQQFEQRALGSTDSKFRDKAKQLTLHNGEVIYVSNQFNPVRINELIEKLKNADLGVNISLIEH